MESLKGILSIWGRFCFAHFVQRKGLRCIFVKNHLTLFGHMLE